MTETLSAQVLKNIKPYKNQITKYIMKQIT